MNSYNMFVICTNSFIRFHINMLIHYLLLLILGDNWQDIKDEHGRHLVIGEFSFNKKRSEGFTASNKCRDVLAAMELSGKLLLEHYSVHDSYSNISDSLMKIIKGTSANGGVNSLTPMGAHERQLFNGLRGTVVSRRVFIRSQSLIAC